MRDRAARHDEVLGGRPVLEVGVERELIVRQHLLVAGVLPAEIAPGRQRPGQEALRVARPGGVVDAVAARHGDGEEVDAAVDRPEQLRPLDVAEHEHAAEQQRELRVGAAELEVEIVDAEDRQRKVERRIDRRADGHRLGAGRGLVADDARVALLHVVAHPLVGVAVHHAIAAPRLDAPRLEVRRVELVSLKRVAFSTRMLRPAMSTIWRVTVSIGRKTWRPPRLADVREAHRLVVRDDGRGQPGLHRLQLHAAERLAIDPDRAAIQRRRVDAVVRREADDAAGARHRPSPCPRDGSDTRRRAPDRAAARAPSPAGAAGTPVDRPPTCPVDREASSSHSTPARSEKNRFSVTTSKPGSVDGRAGNAAPSEPRRRGAREPRSRRRATADARATISPTDSSDRPVTSLRSVTTSSSPSPRSTIRSGLVRHFDAGAIAAASRVHASGGRRTRCNGSRT